MSFGAEGQKGNFFLFVFLSSMPFKPRVRCLVTFLIVFVALFLFSIRGEGRIYIHKMGLCGTRG